MIDIKALRQQKADLVKKIRGLLDATADRDLTAAEDAEYKADQATIVSLNARIERAEKQLDEERALTGASVIEVGDDRAAKKPYNSLGDQLSVIARGTMLAKEGRSHLADPRFKAALGTSEDVPSDGGFLVEPEYSSDLLQKIYDVGQIAKLIPDFEMKSARTVIPVVDEDSRQDGQRWGGLLASWIAEAGSLTGTKPKFRELQLVANKLVGLMYATSELLEDTDLLKSYADKVVPDEFAFQIDNTILQGSGAGQPLGVWNSPTTIQQAIVNSETSISATDILAMYSRLFAPYRKSAVWLIHQALEPKLIPLTVGAGSLAQYLIYQPAGKFGNSVAMMGGLPVLAIEQASAPGIVGDITLFSPDGYLLAKRNALRADSSMHVAFLTDEMAFRWMLRLGGQPWWRKPLQPYYPAGGTAPPTQSAFVTLGPRSGD